MTITDISVARSRRGYVPTNSVEVAAVVDLEHSPIGTRLLINGEPYAVVAHPNAEGA